MNPDETFTPEDEPVGEVDVIEAENNDLAERRRMAAIQMATTVEHPTVGDLLRAAREIDDYLANGTVPSSEEATNV